MMNTIRKTGTLVICVFALSACASMNGPIGDSFGMATERNKQAQIIDSGPPSDEQPYQTGSRAASAIERYESGETSDSGVSSESTGMAPLGMQ